MALSERGPGLPEAEISLVWPTGAREPVLARFLELFRTDAAASRTDVAASRLEAGQAARPDLRSPDRAAGACREGS